MSTKQCKILYASQNFIFTKTRSHISNDSLTLFIVKRRDNNTTHTAEPDSTYTMHMYIMSPLLILHVTIGRNMLSASQFNKSLSHWETLRTWLPILKLNGY